MPRIFSLSSYLRARFGTRVQKIPLDAGFTCPNRDGTLSRNGCIFCNPRGSGSGLLEEGLDIGEQWFRWRNRLGRRYGASLFIAYLQSFSNTHGPPSRLAAVLDELRGLPDLVGTAVGTRPDCLDSEKLSLLAKMPGSERWLEMGLQSAHDETLARINRGHDSDVFARWTRFAAAAGLHVCAHVIIGLPGEDREHALATMDFINGLPVRGVKFHNLYVCHDTRLAEMHGHGEYETWSRDRYIETLVHCLARLRSDIVVQRLTGDAAPGELVAPRWAGDKRALRMAIDKYLEDNDIWQGKETDAAHGPPAWFKPTAQPPWSKP